jgi:hypothetical protein
MKFRESSAQTPEVWGGRSEGGIDCITLHHCVYLGHCGSCVTDGHSSLPISLALLGDNCGDHGIIAEFVCFLAVAGAAPLTGCQRKAGCRRAARARLIAQKIRVDQGRSDRHDKAADSIEIRSFISAYFRHQLGCL